VALLKVKFGGVGEVCGVDGVVGGVGLRRLLILFVVATEMTIPESGLIAFGKGVEVCWDAETETLTFVSNSLLGGGWRGCVSSS